MKFHLHCLYQGCRDLLRVILEKSLLIPGQNAAVMDQVDALMKVSIWEIQNVFVLVVKLTKKKKEYFHSCEPQMKSPILRENCLGGNKT